MSKLVKIISLAWVAGVNCYANAEPVKINMKPGLWEHSFKLSNGSASQAQVVELKKRMEFMKKQFANLSPEQQKIMEAMLAKQGIGITASEISLEGMSISGDGNSLVRACVTQQQIDRGELPYHERCKTELIQQAKNQFRIIYNCTAPAPSGTGEVVFDSPTHYSGTAKFTTFLNGTTQTFEGEQAGKWLTSSCTVPDAEGEPETFIEGGPAS